MEIGKPKRVYVVEPIEDPVPKERPAESDDPVEAPVLPDREEVGAPGS
jgi:hypothetical protein